MTPCAAALAELLESGQRRARVLIHALSHRGYSSEEMEDAKLELSITERRTLSQGTYWLPPKEVRRRARRQQEDPLRCRCGNTTMQHHPETGERMCLACQVKEGVI